MPATGFDDVLLVNPSRVRPADTEDIETAAAALGVALPQEYSAYVRRLGEGALGHFVRVIPPHALAERTHDWRDRVGEYWFWDMLDAGVTAEALQARGVPLADTFDGDELCVLPEQPGACFLLPRDDDVATKMEGGFLATVGTLLSGELNPWAEGWTFEAYDGRAEIRLFRSLGPQLAETVRAVEGLAMHSHVLELRGRATFFLPDVEGRLSLYQLDDDPAASLDFTYDDAADPEVVGRIMAALGSDTQPR